MVPELCETFFCKTKELNPIYWMNHKPDTTWIQLASIYYAAIANFYYGLTNRCCGEKEDQPCSQEEYFGPKVYECIHFAQEVLGSPFETCGDETTTTKTTKTVTDKTETKWWSTWWTTSKDGTDKEPTTKEPDGAGTDKTPTTATEPEVDKLPPCTEKPEFDSKKVDPETVKKCTEILNDFCAGKDEGMPQCKYADLGTVDFPAEYTPAAQTGFVFAAVGLSLVVVFAFFAPAGVL